MNGWDESKGCFWKMAEWKKAGNCKGLGGTARELGAPRTPGAVRVNPFGDALAPLKTQGYKATKSMWLQAAQYAAQGPAFLKAPASDFTLLAPLRFKSARLVKVVKGFYYIKMIHVKAPFMWCLSVLLSQRLYKARENSSK